MQFQYFFFTIFALQPLILELITFFMLRIKAYLQMERYTFFFLKKPANLVGLKGNLGGGLSVPYG